MAVAVHTRGRRVSLAQRHLAQQAQRCLSLGSSKPSSRNDAYLEKTAGTGHRGAGERGDRGRPGVGGGKGDSHLIHRSSSLTHLSGRHLLPCGSVSDDASRRALHTVSVIGPDTPNNVHARVRLRSRPGTSVDGRLGNGRRALGGVGGSRDGSGSVSGLPQLHSFSSLASCNCCSGGVDVANGARTVAATVCRGICTERAGFRLQGGGRGRPIALGFDGLRWNASAWRGLASVNTPEPEQYLRYIHRVNPEPTREDEGGSSDGSNSKAQEPETVSTLNGKTPFAHEPEGQMDGEQTTPSSRPHPSSRFAAVTQRNGRAGNRGKDGSESGDLEDEGISPAEQLSRKSLKAYTAEDILRDKNLLRQQLEVPGNCTVDDAVTFFVNERVTSFIVVNRKREVIGMFTSRDLLGELARYPEKADGLRSKAHQFMIPLNQMIYCSPRDSLYQCLLVMSELKVRNLPVVSEGKVLGIVNVNDISDFSFSSEELGGKKAYMKNISQRKGLPKGVGLDPRQNRPETKQSFYASIGSLALPHPHKMPNGSVSASTREHRHLEFAEDPTLSEDAHFVLDISWPTATTDTVHYVGIADGVGSWRRVGVDPREFSHRLMHWAKQYIMSMSPGDGIGAHVAPTPPKPHQVLRAAWEYTIGEKVIGSSTACVAALDYDLEQLTFSNIGDCGVVVLRHIDSDVAGYMREKKTPRHLRDSDLRLAFISQQQLRSFNLPYQFGYTNVPEDNANFETPRDAVNTSFPVRPGDIILLATDGLFDNMELDDICAVALGWELKWFGGPMCGLSEHNNAAMDDLAQQLGHRARELSLDRTRDSPFALLAKENDIMWGGGMPDDITIVALRVINKSQSSADALSKRGVGQDEQDVDQVAYR